MFATFLDGKLEKSELKKPMMIDDGSTSSDSDELSLPGKEAEDDNRSFEDIRAIEPSEEINQIGKLAVTDEGHTSSNAVLETGADRLEMTEIIGGECTSPKIVQVTEASDEMLLGLEDNGDTSTTRIMKVWTQCDVTHTGARIYSNTSDVEVIIPPGAIPEDLTFRVGFCSMVSMDSIAAFHYACNIPGSHTIVSPVVEVRNMCLTDPNIAMEDVLKCNIKLKIPHCATDIDRNGKYISVYRLEKLEKNGHFSKIPSLTDIKDFLKQSKFLMNSV